MQSTSRAVPHADIGTELVREWAPAGEPRAIIVLVHGLAEHSGRYERTGHLLSEAGFHVRSFDLIGHGASGGARVDIDDWNRFHHQVHDHMEAALGEGRPVILLGHSMGSSIAAGYCLEERHQPDLLVLTAPMFGGGARWQRLVAKWVSKVLPRLAIPQKIDGTHLSRDPAVADAYFADPMVYTKATVRFGAALFAAMDGVASEMYRIEVPTLMLHGGLDYLVPTASSEFLEDIPLVERRVYPGLYHEILNEPEGPQVVADIIDWINERL